MKMVCNASPLIILAQTEHLLLLSQLFDTVMVPEAVWNEVRLHGLDSPVTTALTQAHDKGVFEIFHVANRLAVNTMLGRLHLGEIETIIGSHEINSDGVILDDLFARKKAKQMGLSVIGSVGIFIMAHKRGILPDLMTVCDSLRTAKFRISDELLKEILKAAEVKQIN